MLNRAAAGVTITSGIYCVAKQFSSKLLATTDDKIKAQQKKILDPNEGDWMYQGHGEKSGEGTKDLGPYA